MRTRYKLLCKIESELFPEDPVWNTSWEKGEYDSKAEALSYGMKYAGDDKYTAFQDYRTLPENLPKIHKTADTVWLIVSGIGEDYDNIKITYYTKEKIYKQKKD